MRVLFCGLLLYCFGACSINKFQARKLDTQSESPSLGRCIQERQESLLLQNKSNYEMKSSSNSSFSESTASAKLQETFLAGDRLNVIFSTKCLQREGFELAKNLGIAKNIFEEIKNSSISFFSTQFLLSEDKTYAELNDYQRKNDCVLAVTKLYEEKASQESFSVDDTYYGYQDYMTGMRWKESLDFFWNSETGLKKNVVVSVIDSGLDYQLEDLKNRVWLDDQGKVGHDFVDPGTDAFEVDDHGTAVSSIIASEVNNQNGLAGVAGNASIIMPLKIFNSEGQGRSSDRFNAIQYAVNKGAEVINLSVTTTDSSTAYKDLLADVVEKNSVVVVASAGNYDDSDPHHDLSKVARRFPAYYSQEIFGFLSVGSLKSDWKTIAPHSLYHPSLVEIAAQGEAVYVANPKKPPVDGSHYNFYRASGTSFSAPMVSAAAALIIGIFKSNNIPYSAEVVEDIILTSSKKESSLSDKIKNGSILDLKAIADELQNRYTQLKANRSPASTESEEETDCGVHFN